MLDSIFYLQKKVSNTQHNATQRNTTQHNATQRNTTQRNFGYLFNPSLCGHERRGRGRGRGRDPEMHL